jgi:hypothetical protein
VVGMKEVMVKQTMYEMQLKQMGAKIISYHGLHCFVKFNINEFEITYSYNINSKNQFYLQRIKPYPINIGVYKEINDIVETIKADIEKFRNALQSGKFDKFLEVNTKLLEAAKNLEDLFLYYIVDEKVFNELSKMVTELEDKIASNIDENKKV